MTIEQRVQAALVASSGLTAIIPALRIRAHMDNQNLTRPFLIHFPVTAEPLYTHEGIAALTNRRWYQVDIVADTPGAARAAAKAAADALKNFTNGMTCFWRGERESYDAEIRCTTLSLDFQIFEADSAS